MKLIFCPRCGDVVALREGQWRTCDCGNAGGRYTDSVNAEIVGSAIPIGFENASFVEALAARPEDGDGSRFTAFVIPEECENVRTTSEERDDDG